MLCRSKQHGPVCQSAGLALPPCPERPAKSLLFGTGSSLFGQWHPAQRLPSTVLPISLHVALVLFRTYIILL